MSDPVPVYTNATISIPPGGTAGFVTVHIPDDMYESWFGYSQDLGEGIHFPAGTATVDSVDNTNPLASPTNTAGFISLHPHGTVLARVAFANNTNTASGDFFLVGIDTDLTSQDIDVHLSSNESSFGGGTVTVNNLNFSFVMGTASLGESGPSAVSVDSGIVEETESVVPVLLSTVSGRAFFQIIG